MSSSIEPLAFSGLLLIDKPTGITSFDIIRALRRQTGIRKIGHAGTLDPMATGLMLMLIGAATKQASRFSGLDKAYQAEITLGATSSTGDAEGELTQISNRSPRKAELDASLTHFTGPITQTPPKYSAIKVNGVRAYKLAREGKNVVMPPRQVKVHRLQITNYAYPYITLQATVSSGTYIRSLAIEIGEHLKTGAYLSSLRRVSVGPYTIAQAHNLAGLNHKNIAASVILAH